MDVPEPTPEELAAWEAKKQRTATANEKLRQARNIVLGATDKYATIDFPHGTDEQKTKWLRYRQHLRDLPAMSSPELDENGELTGVEWPVPPK
jgi:uncharacterized protein YjiS (DUF1127 family)